MPETPPPDEAAVASPAPPAAVEPEAPSPEEWERRFTYLYADFENYRRRTERERESQRRRAEGEVLREALPIMEAAEKAVEAVGRLPARDPVRRGVEMLQRTVTAFLDAHQVHPVAQVGEPFRSEEHEAVAEAPPSAVAPEGTVFEVVQQGYAFPGGLLRPAKVVVAQSRPKEPAAGPDRTKAPAGPDDSETPS
jgi:molecular chaperone GrpE